MDECIMLHSIDMTLQTERNRVSTRILKGKQNRQLGKKRLCRTTA